MSKIRLSDHFTYRKLYRFVLPPVVMMIFTSVYTVVDGFFVSNYAGKEAFASLNIIFPFLMILGAFGFMMGAGGSALVAKTLGEGKRELANGIFSLVTYTAAGLGLALAAAGMIFMRPIAVLLGATEELEDGCVIYGSIMTAAIPLFMLQNMFQSFFVTAEKQHAGLYVIVGAGLTNAVGDWILVGICRFGLAGAATASAIGQTVGAVLPIIYFSRKNSGLLRLGKPKGGLKAVVDTMANGSSELLGNLSASVVGALYNIKLIALAGEDGVDAYGIIMYVAFIFSALFFGFCMGSTPVIGYHFGAGNKAELKNLFKKATVTVTVCGLIMAALSFALARPLALLFAGYDPSLADMTERGMRIYSFSFIIMGLNVFASSLFTALNDGLRSAIVSFLRTLVFQALAIFILPLVVKPAIDGVWAAVIMAEGLSLIVSVGLVVGARRKYEYFPGHAE